MKRVIFHHNDNDGKAAAAIVYQVFKEQICSGDITLDDISFLQVDYNKSIPVADLIDEGDCVFILDYSFTKATVHNLIDISKKAKMVYWFDHHLSSLEVYDYIKENNICTSAIVDTTRSGALITYDVFNSTNRFKQKKFKFVKQIIDLVDDYDRWIHKNPDSMLFNIGSQMEDTYPTSDLWISDPSKVIETGRIIKEYNDKKNSRLTRKNGFLIKINGHECIVLNTPEASSQAFAEYFDTYKFAIRFVFNGKNYEYSIYSELEDVNCAEIAKHFNPKGGGHKGAAGFVSDKLEFVDKQVFVI